MLDPDLSKQFLLADLGDAAILFGVITARNSSSRKVIFSQVSVILSGGVGMSRG